MCQVSGGYLRATDYVRILRTTPDYDDNALGREDRNTWLKDSPNEVARTWSQCSGREMFLLLV